MKSLLIVSLSLASLVSFAQATFAENSEQKYQAPLFNNLGSYHFPISTKMPMAQKFFNQGMVLYYGFEWGESIRSFQEATRLDPNCGMCYWGLAMAIGSKINAPVSGHEYIDAKEAISKALALKNEETPAEQAYIQALATLYQHKPKPFVAKSGIFSCHASSSSLDISSDTEIKNYAQAMKKVASAYPSDFNAQSLYADALFNTIHWQSWDKNEKMNPITPQLLKTLQHVIAKDKKNIGANHYYIHVVESSPKPGIGTKSADALGPLVPGSEHLVHMPAHIYFLTGRYHDGSKANQQAIAAFKEYYKECKHQGFTPEINYLYFHNYDFLRSTAAMEGRKEVALSAVHDMLLPPYNDWLKNEMALQWFIPIPYFVKARFGLWHELLQETKPNEKYRYGLAMWHYARGLAYAELKDTNKANDEAAALEKIIKTGSKDPNLGKPSINLLKIADSVLRGMIYTQQGNETLAISNLKAAVKIQHDMGYHEPPDWYFPTKEVLAYAYLKWHHPAQAEDLFMQDLQQYPKNGWALYGLAESMRQLGKTQQADEIEKEYQEAWKYSDIPHPVDLFNN